MKGSLYYSPDGTYDDENLMPDLNLKSLRWTMADPAVSFGVVTLPPVAAIMLPGHDAPLAARAGRL